MLSTATAATAVEGCSVLTWAIALQSKVAPLLLIHQPVAVAWTDCYC